MPKDFSHAGGQQPLLQPQHPRGLRPGAPHRAARRHGRWRRRPSSRALAGCAGGRRAAPGRGSASRASPPRRPTPWSCPRATPPRCWRHGANRWASPGAMPAWAADASQQRRRAGAADGHAPRRPALLRARRQPPRPAGDATTSTPTTACCTPAACSRGRREKVAKSQAAHGISVIEIELQAGRWQMVRPSRYARRFTASTPFAVGGPAAGHALMKTAADPAGRTRAGHAEQLRRRA